MLTGSSIEILCLPEDVFKWYLDAEKWHLWDPEVEGADIPGGLRVGARGWIKPKSGPRAKIRIVEVTPNISFSVESHLPLCVMRFEHWLEHKNGQTIATHSVIFTGWFSFIFRRMIGKAIAKGLPATMDGLKKICEQDQRSER